MDEGNDAFGFECKAQEPGRLLRGGFHSKDILDDSGGFVKPIAKNSDVSHKLLLSNSDIRTAISDQLNIFLRSKKAQVSARSPEPTGKRIQLSQSKNHIQTVIFSRETRWRIFPAEYFSKPGRSKIQLERKLFLKKSQLFCRMAGAGKFWVLGVLEAGAFLGFGAFWRLQKPSETA